MKTSVMKTDTKENMDLAVQTAAETIKNGGIVAIPTETVYGLGANALDEAAVKRIFKAKGRPQDNPLIVHIADISMLDRIVRERGEIRDKLAAAFWPGPLTIIYPKSDLISNTVTAGLDSVAVRMPSHPVAREIIRRAGVPVAAPSANRSGRPSTTTAKHVYEDLCGRIPLIIDGGDCEVGVESTVVAVKGNAITVLRPGGVTVEMLKNALPNADVTVAEAVMRPLKDGEVALSPGMKHKHYSPKAKVLLIDGSKEQTVAFAGTYTGKNAVFIGEESLCKKVGIDSYAYGVTQSDEAHMIFDLLRRADADGYETVIIRVSETDGIGLAINNRILRAAGFEVIKL